MSLDQESYEREEKAIFHGSEAEVLKYIQTLICFANHVGGEIFIKEVKKENLFKTFFDAAILESKINSYIEPVISGIIAVNNYNRKKGVRIKIKKSNCSPHFYKTDGYFINLKKEKILVFQRGSIGIRRSGRNDIFNGQDLEALFKNKLTEVFNSIQEIVVKQPMGELFGRLKGVSSEIVSYKYDPSDSRAIPVRQVLDTEPFHDLSEELNASVKAWKTNGILLNEISIARAYSSFKDIKNKEHIELLLLSSLEKRLPAYAWASKIKKAKLKILLKEIIKKDTYPSINEVIKLISMLPHRPAKEMLELAKQSRLISVRNLVVRVFEKIDTRNKDRVGAVKQYLFSAGTSKSTNQSSVGEISSKFDSANKEERASLRQIWRIKDLEIFGVKLV